MFVDKTQYTLNELNHKTFALWGLGDLGDKRGCLFPAFSMWAVVLRFKSEAGDTPALFFIPD